ncbi:MAG: medium chain dehydrogenase/reductase family protein [Rhodothermales bacterium]
MEKIVIHRPGGFNRLQIESCPNPVPGEEEVLVQTKAVGVNYADCVVRMGFYASAKEYVGWPITPGFEFSGVVTAVGEKVQDLAVGTRVFGVTRFNAYATHVVVPRHQVYVLPEHVSFEEAGGFPTIYLTAYHALHMIVRIYPGSTILVHSAAGGVGTALVQLSRLAGWRIIGVVGSSHKVEAARAHGADVVIDKSTENLWQKVEQVAPDGLDVVLDGNGAMTLRQGYKHLRPTGKLISYGFHSMFPKSRGIANPFKLLFDYVRTPRFNPVDLHKQNRTLVTFNLSFLFDRHDLLREAIDALYPWFANGDIRMPAVTTYPFENVAQAHRDLQSGMTIGKLVLVP